MTVPILRSRCIAVGSTSTRRPATAALRREVVVPVRSPRVVALLAIWLATLALAGGLAQIVHALERPIASQASDALRDCRDDPAWLACTMAAMRLELEQAPGCVETAPGVTVAAPDRGWPETRRRIGWRAAERAWFHRDDYETSVTPGGAWP